ncbi:DUF1761 domain-containing protein [Aeromicrobium terrae]|uniref:DUF1761 domain-containing protein n=1 Tax=Aeromicrobium terrae TaxID=2498846 RepID=A0A5C8NL78_9ACTN|nr:DUF1761 domain-containing protein [Aeromicrobium terrae]TXL61807.1 DUF1761 domain-containing protein [Aeromicrobium terrae]
MDDFSWLAVIIAAMAFFFIGAIWYTFLFRKPWMADMGIQAEGPPQSPGPQLLIGSFVVALVLSGVIEALVDDGGTSCGFWTGVGVGAAIAAVMGQNALYDSRPLRLWIINAGYAFVGSVVVGLIAGAISA